MALSTITLSARLGDSFAKETTTTSTKSVVSTTAVVIYMIEIDNLLNTSAPMYVKCWDAATGSITVGTTAPPMILFASAASKVTYAFDQGVSFGTGLVLACVDSAGTAGTTSPSNNVIVKLIYT